MAKPDLSRGAWTGRLVDVQGFEGDVAIDLGGRGDEVEGSFHASIQVTHGRVEVRGAVRGQLRKDRLELSFTGEEEGVGVVLQAKVVALTTGGAGLCGTYQISARGFSPLQGGVAVLNRDQAGTDVEVKPEVPAEPS